MPDDNSTMPNPASAAAPVLPTVTPDDASTTTAPEAPSAPTEAATAPIPEPVVPDAVSSAPVSDAVVTPVTPDENPEKATTQSVVDPETPAEVARKISEAHNVLVALSSDPSVDEMAAAIGLSLYLDKLGKRATAIYSGATPNALEFLKPEETFEDSVDTLQDFVIALNKEKADHLRYKLDGEFVKIYITPYKSKIVEEDLEFSYGDYNVDLVLALDVANGVDLDAALREHGRIMHDAVIINITTGNPGKLGEIEWSDKSASSVSEMIARLLYSANSKVEIGKEEATAFLTGIVAATNRFSNAGTTPETMKMASRLMESGANQQLVSKNITPDIENELFGLPGMAGETKDENYDPTKLDIEHGNEEGVDETKVVTGTVTEKESTLLDDLKAAEASLAAAGAEITEESNKGPLKIDATKGTDSLADVAEVANEVKEEASHDADMVAKAETEAKSEPKTESESNVESGDNSEPEVVGTDTTTENPSSDFVSDKPEKIIQPPSDSDMAGAGLIGDGEAGKYGQMLEDALASVGSTSEPTASIVSEEPVVGENPAMAGAPAVPTNPEINGVPEINYMPMPGDEVLPPPPAPPIDMDAPAPEAAAPVVEPTPVAGDENTPLGTQPAMQDQVYAPQAVDPAAFKIPGM
ncbi:hypothetical protein IKF20_01155 [Candidatus Saccharibacteria bacterium]|nr:hypothetical protein [Candidatus Saccharibacteria bacterium]MBR3157027.1 hypothetical protein [Candidatus Saccharibacteria bacterium]